MYDPFYQKKLENLFLFKSSLQTQSIWLKLVENTDFDTSYALKGNTRCFDSSEISMSIDLFVFLFTFALFNEYLNASSETRTEDIKLLL